MRPGVGVERREREEGRGAEKEREREESVKIVKREGWGNELMVMQRRADTYTTKWPHTDLETYYLERYY